jgi:hypothetical protein
MIPIATKRAVPRLLTKAKRRAAGGNIPCYLCYLPSARPGPMGAVPPVIVATSAGGTTDGLGCLCARAGPAASRNSPADTPRSSAGVKVAAGCSRTTASSCLTTDLARSAATATVSWPDGRQGPQPRLASWRSRRSTAVRCASVSPGRR